MFTNVYVTSTGGFLTRGLAFFPVKLSGSLAVLSLLPNEPEGPWLKTAVVVFAFEAGAGSVGPAALLWGPRVRRGCGRCSRPSRSEAASGSSAEWLAQEGALRAWAVVASSPSDGSRAAQR